MNLSSFIQGHGNSLYQNMSNEHREFALGFAIESATRHVLLAKTHTHISGESRICRKGVGVVVVQPWDPAQSAEAFSNYIYIRDQWIMNVKYCIQFSSVVHT